VRAVLGVLSACKHLRVDYGIECDMKTKGWLVMDEDKIIAEFNEKAIEEYALANSLLCILVSVSKSAVTRAPTIALRETGTSRPSSQFGVVEKTIVCLM
jgi:hypothetical protein